MAGNAPLGRTEDRSWTFADYMTEPTRNGFSRGTIYRVTFPNGGGVAKQTIPYAFADAVIFFDPFQKA